MVEMTRDNSTELKKLIRISEVLRSSIHPNIPLALVHSFLIAAQHSNEGVNELANRVGMSKSTMSRHLLDLSERLRNGKPGYGLLKRNHDNPDLREVRYTVTHKGSLVLSQLQEIAAG